MVYSYFQYIRLKITDIDLSVKCLILEMKYLRTAPVIRQNQYYFHDNIPPKKNHKTDVQKVNWNSVIQNHNFIFESLKTLASHIDSNHKLAKQEKNIIVNCDLLTNQTETTATTLHDVKTGEVMWFCVFLFFAKCFLFLRKTSVIQR